MAEDKPDKLVKSETPLVKAEPFGWLMERPAWIKSGDVRGTEGITKNDISMPRLALAQGMTPQVMKAKPGFSPGVMFHSATEEVYGKGPLEFAILRRDPPRWMEFFPRNSPLGKGIKDKYVPAGDVRTIWGMNGEKPVATMFYDFFIVLLPLMKDPLESIICLSMKGSSIKAATALNRLLWLRRIPLWAGRYTVSSNMEEKDGNIYAVFKCNRAENPYIDETLNPVLEMLWEGLRDREIEVDREGEEEGEVYETTSRREDDDLSFDPAELERQR